jgi:hypothetical protein
VAVGLCNSGDGLGGADFEVAFTKRGECSMVSLREADLPRAAPCRSDAASPWAPQNVHCRPTANRSHRGGRWRGGRRADRRRGSGYEFWLRVAGGGNGLRGAGFWGPRGREVVVGIGFAGILESFRVAVMLGAEGRVCGRKWALSWSLSE